MTLALPIILLAIATWGAVHSWLASLEAKGVIGRALGERGARFHRVLYNLFSFISFAPILLLVSLLPDRVLYLVRPPFEYGMRLGQFLGVIGVLLALRQTDALGLVGLRQLMGQEERAALVTGGLYSYTRHPMYFFGLLIIWLTPLMTVNVLVVCLGLTGYLWIGAHYEEKKLSRIFGRDYDAYKSQTPMMIPFLRLGRAPGSTKTRRYV